MYKDNNAIGVVVIGRNEGERLKRCFAAILPVTDKVIYVDSDSSDGSVKFVNSVNVDVHELNLSIPFNAGRARNEGFKLLCQKYKDLRFIQFVDGDCVLYDDWLTIAYEYLDKNDLYALVTGRLNELFPEKSIYNELCNIEWMHPYGEVDTCGGIFLVRKDAFENLNGFNQTMIAGEEPEFCFRLIKNKWKISHLNYPMATHDANILFFSQWWKRTVRSGYAYAQGFFLHRKDEGKYCYQEIIRIWFWSIIILLIIAAAVIFFSFWSIILLVVFPLKFIKIFLSTKKKIHNNISAFRYSVFNMIGKWPQLIGQIIFLYRQFYQKKNHIIEYK